jgi:hypothetical protein
VGVVGWVGVVLLLLLLPLLLLLLVGVVLCCVVLYSIIVMCCCGMLWHAMYCLTLCILFISLINIHINITLPSTTIMTHN